ncbi:aspartate/prephenate aminotransferase-like [Clavelina lepadiformis]|uniref:aspartate/prephenate aminotransferase-like n=1 Tax=Clavelina lepadiformis TaxID=159417 RepID=UPI0040410007
MELGQCFLKDSLKQSKSASNLQFHEHIKSLQEKGVKIHHLGFGQSPFPVPQFAQDELKRYSHVGEYLPIRGLLKLREVVCQLHSREDDLHHFKASDVIVGPGSKELIFLLLAVTNGDVLLLAPTWTTYKPQALLSNHTVHKIPTNFEEGWKLTPERLEMVFEENKVKKNSVLIFCNPDNPTGTSYSANELKSLSEVFRKHKLLVVSDEIYSRLSFSGQYTSLAKFYPEGTVVSCGISKWASCGGWRLGYHLYPPHLKAVGDAVASAASQTFTSASAPIQYAAIELLKFGDNSRSYVFHCRRILQAVAKFCCRTLEEHGVHVREPHSGYYIFPDFETIRSGLTARGVTTGTGMCLALLEDTGVAVMAGGPAYLHGDEDLTVRLCYVNFDGAAALTASEELGAKDFDDSFLEKFCAPTVDAINKIVAWVDEMKIA